MNAPELANETITFLRSGHFQGGAAVRRDGAGKLVVRPEPSFLSQRCELKILADSQAFLSNSGRMSAYDAYDAFRRRKIRILCFLGPAIALFFLGALLQGRLASPWNQIMMLTCVCISFVSMLFYHYSFHCPKCRQRVNVANTSDDGYIGVPNFCAHCGLDFMSVDTRNEPV
ncbi:MAG: hypothetical protein ACR2NX_16115 [Chthoniobacterales bacterium]